MSMSFPSVQVVRVVLAKFLLHLTTSFCAIGYPHLNELARNLGVTHIKDLVARISNADQEEEREWQADEAALDALSTLLLHDDIWEAGLIEIENAKGVRTYCANAQAWQARGSGEGHVVLEQDLPKNQSTDIFMEQLHASR